MLGEGFDLPELKIAAVHDPQKSLAVTLQFAGRFVRPAPAHIGSATFIANVASVAVEEALKGLYADDADWNTLLPQLSEGATSRQLRRSEFIAGFIDPPARVSLQAITPKMSTVVYRTPGRTWSPNAILDVVKPARLYAGPSVHATERVAVFVTREETPVPWGSVRELRDTIWDLYLLHFDPARQLLFINSSNNDTLHQGLARAVGGEGATILGGEQVFRALAGINRLMLMNVGLRHAVSRFVSFSMHVGSDIKQALTAAQAANKTKSNVFGRGYANGARVSIGCSSKGRLWAHWIAEDIPEWIEWCRATAAKVLDESISTEAVLAGVLYPEEVSDRPPAVPVSVEWPERMLVEPEERTIFDLDGVQASMLDTDVELTSYAESGPLRFRVVTATTSVDITMRFEGGGVAYKVLGDIRVRVRVGRVEQPLAEFLQEERPGVQIRRRVHTAGQPDHPPPATSAPVVRSNANCGLGLDRHRHSEGVANCEQVRGFHPTPGHHRGSG